MRSSFSRLVIALALLCLAPFAATTHAQDTGKSSELQFLADTTAVEPGKPFYVGFKIKLEEHFHLFWRFPGSVGEIFRVVSWNLPPGWKADPVNFPLPTAGTSGEQPFIGYEWEVMLPVKITPPKDLKGGPVEIGASVKWQVCDPKSCIPGSETVKLKLPVGAGQPANADLFRQWLAQLPQTGEPPTKAVTFSFVDKKLTVRISGLPKDTEAEFFPILPRRYTGTLDAKAVTSETAADGTRVVTYPFESDMDWSGLLVTKSADGVRKGWYINDPPELTVEQPDAAPSRSSAPVAAVADDGQTWDPFDEVAALLKNDKEPGGNLWVLLLNGFLGGLLLNIMPCVLPVISLKIFGFVEQAGQSRERIFKLGLAFCGGVFAFFMGLAVLVLGLASANKTLGWGAQFSNPIGLTIMVGVMFLFGLSLLGVFEITLGGGTNSKLSELSGKKGHGGAFVHGFFTTLLGTSCTAPLVGPVLGTAINQPGIRIFALFGAIALGLSLPYFLLTWQPAWMRFLPKPGAWMVRFKQLMGFVMIIFCVWLLGSLPSKPMVVAVSYFLITLGVAAWLYGTYHQSWWPIPVTLALIAFGWWFFVQDEVKLPPAQNSGLVVAVRKGLSEGRPVFVDFTADWCFNCKAYEKAVLRTEAVQKALKDKNVQFVVGDYTHEAPDIAAALKKMNRVGVPSYILFRRRAGVLKADDFWIYDGGATAAPLLAELAKLPGH
jgi:DsbC/DsbD-like thiol-disulfide interchange protein/thiol-disulfide isomerase/thioredoxin